MCSGSGTPGKSTVPSGNNGNRAEWLTRVSVRADPYSDRAMLTTIDLRGRAEEARRMLPRATQDVGAALGVVRPLCDDVRERGAIAVRDATTRFDGVDIDELRVSPDRLAAAL